MPSSVGGLLKFDGTDWTLYDKSNSPMPYNLVYTLTIDLEGNIWTGSVNFDEPGGLAMLHPGSTSAVEEIMKTHMKPSTFSLSQNYPNPFNPETTIEYELVSPSEVRLSIYNLSGQTVRILKNEFQNAGSYQIKWNGRNDTGQGLSDGVYFLELVINGFDRHIKSMVLSK